MEVAKRARLRFFGAVGEVTGSCHLLQYEQGEVLLDCGLFQGGNDADQRNAANFPFDPEKIDALILSHAHIDHCGRLPLLVKRGFNAPIYTHPATARLLRVMLEDSARLALADAKHANRRRAREGRAPIEPLYGLEDVEAVHGLVVAIPYAERQAILPGLELCFADAGHILGAAIVQLWVDSAGETRHLVFSGDIGSRDAPFMVDPERISSADLVLMESTYGDRLHRARSDTVAELGGILESAWNKGGNVLIPAFAVGRSQELLYWLAKHHRDWGLDRWRIYLDSPMAVKVTSVYKQHHELFDEEMQADWHGPRNPFKMKNLKLVSSVEESRALNQLTKGAIIIAGSGMCTGGRIRHHLKHNLWRPQCHVLFSGYQANGTLGRKLVDGAKHVSLMGERIRVAANLHTIGGLSAHADQNGLAEWYGGFANRPPVCLLHGEDRSRSALAVRLRDQFGAEVSLAELPVEVEI